MTDATLVSTNKARVSFSKLNDKTIKAVRISATGSIVIQTEDVGFIIKAEPPNISLQGYDKLEFEKLAGNIVFRASAKPRSSTPIYEFHKIHAYTVITLEFHDLVAPPWSCTYYGYGSGGTERTAPSLFMVDSGLSDLINLEASNFEISLDVLLNGARAFDFNKLFQVELF